MGGPYGLKQEKTMKAFVIIINEVVDFDKFVHEPIVCATKDVAQREYNRIIAEVKEAYASEIDDGWEVNESDDCFETYPEGGYSGNHYSAAIYEVEVVSE